MAQAVWKFEIPAPGSTTIHDMPAGAIFAHVDWQNGDPVSAQAWFVVNAEATDDVERKELGLVATGQKFTGDHLGTFVHQESGTVWHLIEGDL